MRRVHLRGHENILKRVLVQAGALNLALLMRRLVGIGTPRSLQGRGLALLACLWSLLPSPERLEAAIRTLSTDRRYRLRSQLARFVGGARRQSSTVLASARGALTCGEV